MHIGHRCFAAARGAIPRMSRSEYIARYSELAIKEMAISGIPASITLAKACWSRAMAIPILQEKRTTILVINAARLEGKTIKHSDDAPNECFRKYNHARNLFVIHSDFLRYWDHYAFLFDPGTLRLQRVELRAEKGGLCYCTQLCRIIDIHHRKASALPIRYCIANSSLPK